ncbi:MAG: hypothetical protein M1833_000406 [Piccolia ochrophora]|nr:MAG: hypothetical protein M1833_000406 [Piccolia ochrophora]
MPPHFTIVLAKDLETVDGRAPSSRTQTHNRILCKSCSAILGTFDESASGFRILKSSVAVQSTKGSTAESFSKDVFLAAQLLSLIDHASTRRVAVYDERPIDTDKETVLLLWIFSTDLRYSSSTVKRNPKRAMKVLFRKSVNLGEQPGMSFNTSEDLHLPSDLKDHLEHSLETSSSMLPVSSRYFQEWTVGLLERFQPED